MSHLSAKVDYACRAILELALHWPNVEPMQVNEIARRQQIPLKFLPHILLHLKDLGYVESTRGKSGGYRLKVSPREIQLGKIFFAFNGGEFIDRPSSKSRYAMDLVWQDINKTISESMEKLNFEVISDRARKNNQSLMFEI
ncbi:MAG: Rrf2 family transcriptional regulator [Candidatus Omnitrophica bacterium]|nr:Rrf2 family transcriptional regulator [Candidatus Omnitrophota bacterium]